jgi:hypothetical protein
MATIAQPKMQQGNGDQYHRQHSLTTQQENGDQYSYPNQPHGWKCSTALSPVVRFVMIISPSESTHVRPNIRLLTFVSGGTKSKTTPDFLSVTLVL